MIVFCGFLYRGNGDGGCDGWPAMRMKVEGRRSIRGIGFRVQGLGLRGKDLGCRGYCYGNRTPRSGVLGSGSGIKGLGLRIKRLKVNSRFNVGFWVQGA
jgi:hypothetical protein